MRRRATTLPAVLVLLLAPALVACGSDDPEAGSDPAPSASSTPSAADEAGETAGAFPVQVEDIDRMSVPAERLVKRLHNRGRVAIAEGVGEDGQHVHQGSSVRQIGDRLRYG